jgi:methylated-DNA-[protein]-cysteine S-methyltransferase
MTDSQRPPKAAPRSLTDEQVAHLATRIRGAAQDQLEALRTRLADEAEQARLLDVGYRSVDSPLGALLLAATEAGVVRVAFAMEDHDAVLAALARAISTRVLLAPRRLDAAARQLDEYFAGRRHHFEVPTDLRLASGFRRSVLDHLPTIPYGRTASYRAVAEAVHNPRAVRAVGTACATNPVPLLVPCHRVIRSDGQAGAYRGGPEAKAVLLGLEASA